MLSSGYKDDDIPTYKQFRLYILSWWWSDVYGIYMRVSLFGLSSWRTNFMDLAIELIQSILPTSTYNTFCWWFIACLDEYALISIQYNLLLDLVRFYLNLLFTICLLDFSTWPTITLDTRVLPMHTTWLHFIYSLGYFFWQSVDLRVYISEFGLWWTSCC